MNDIIIIIATFLISAVIFIPVGIIIRKKIAESKIESAENEAKRLIELAKKDAENKRKEEIFKAISGKIKEINQTLPHYKAIRGIILTEEPLIKTTTNKIKRQNNLDAIMKEEGKCNYKI